MTKLGKVEHFPWRDKLERNEWPGRELFWVWCHPILSFVLLLTAIGTATIYLSGV